LEIQKGTKVGLGCFGKKNTQHSHTVTAVTATRSKESTVAPIHFLVTVSLRDGAELLGFSPRQRPPPAAASVVMGILLYGCAFIRP